MSDTEHYDDLDGDVVSRPAKHWWGRWWFLLVVIVALSVVITVVFDTPGVTTILAVLLGAVIFRTGWFFLQSFATPLPEPPDPGTLRKVKLVYRCEICGTEVRMTSAITDDPEAPRHCMDDMTLVTPIE